MIEYISREEFEEISKEGFTYESLNKFSGILITRAVEQVLVTLPSVIHSLIGQASLMKGVSEKFYKENPDLVEHKILVAQAIEVVQSQNPGMKIEEILRRTAPIVREKIITFNNAEARKESRFNLASLDQELGNL